MSRDPDVIEAFYDHHPYPPPTDLDAVVARDSLRQKAASHLVWPRRPSAGGQRILVAGCGTSQAVRHAKVQPSAHVVGIDVSTSGIELSRRLARRDQVTNVELRRLPIEQVHRLGQTFDYIVCTGVIHHLADPLEGLKALRSVLAPGGAITVMVYAPYGRTGIYLMQDYCRRLGLSATKQDLAGLTATLRELPTGHPISRLLRESPDFRDDDALADALLNPRDRAYSVPQLLALLDAAGLRFGRWARQAPYLPDCGSMSETPHAARIAALPPAEQYAALELFRGTIARHTVIAYPANEPAAEQLEFCAPEAARWRPIRAPTATVVTERLPRGAAAVLLNRAHSETDLVLFVTSKELRMFHQIDGEQDLASLGPAAPAFVERLFRHDLVVIDASNRAEVAT